MPPTVGHRSVKCGVDAVAGAGDNDTQQALPSGGGARPHNQASSHQDTIKRALPPRGGTLTISQASKSSQQVNRSGQTKGSANFQQALPSGGGVPIK